MSEQSPQEQNTSPVPSTNLPEVRRIWHHNQWYYAVVDFIRIWAESEDPSAYWRQMKRRELIEQRTGVAIVSKKNAKDLRQIAPKNKKKEPLLLENTLFDQES